MRIIEKFNLKKEHYNQKEMENKIIDLLEISKILKKNVDLARKYKVLLGMENKKH